MIKRLIDLYHSHDVDFYCSLLGPLLMGTIHLVSVLIHFDWITLNYCVFSYLIMLFKVFQWSIERFNLKINPYVAALIMLIVIIAPMMASFVLTIKFADNPTYIFDWIIYVYAAYGTIKMILSIRSRIKSKGETTRTYILSWIGLISALYTIMMMEFKLIMFAEEGSVSNEMNMMMLFTQGAIFIFTLFVVGLFVYKLVNDKKNKIDNNSYDK